eukprot:CAMPEP_0168533866 /NCGR_PEP_ID=MMETSP0405-20121227/17441_1 /TAXON_ID=498012 /ORGANISM="Trichosphaerium sp, Strain Am-I-7 wt" /LENGTH=59 /DNA_ID=CAMNT_0008560227 /DNA_START=52 /DNA_END=231 /DNA_ORIENTATION=-
MNLFQVVVTLLLAYFSVGVEAAAAFDAGDGIALVLFLVIGVVGILAVLGYCARRRAGAA